MVAALLVRSITVLLYEFNAKLQRNDQIFGHLISSDDSLEMLAHRSTAIVRVHKLETDEFLQNRIKYVSLFECSKLLLSYGNRSLTFALHERAGDTP